MKPEAYEHVIMFLQRYEQATGLEGLNKHTASSLLLYSRRAALSRLTFKNSVGLTTLNSRVIT